MANNFVFGAKSIAYQAGMHPTLRAVFGHALAISPIDFGFTEPQVRTPEYQATLVARGVSKDLRSNHILALDKTGMTTNKYGHAGDAVPWINGAWSWDWNALYVVSAAVAEAAREIGVLKQMCWGGVWDQWMSQYAGAVATPAMMRQAEASYCVRHPGKDFVDGPHFQFAVKG